MSDDSFLVLKFGETRVFEFGSERIHRHLKRVNTKLYCSSGVEDSTRLAAKSFDKSRSSGQPASLNMLKLHRILRPNESAYVLLAAAIRQSNNPLLND